MLRYSHSSKPASKKAEENRLIFIDRDGVINVDPIGDYIKSWNDFKYESGAVEALKQITDLGFEIVIVSNQAGIGDKVYPESVLREIHRNMIRQFEEKGISVRSAHYCLHGKNEGCACRKPRTGLFEDAIRHVPIRKEKTFFIGDKVTDMEAGKKFGIKTIMVRTGHGRSDEKLLSSSSKPDHIVDSLKDAVPILSKQL